MQKTGIFTSSAITMVVALLVLISVPVFAVEGSTDTITTTTSTEMQDKKRATATERKAQATSENHARLATVNEGDRDNLKKAGALLLAEAKKQQRSEKSAEAKAKACENRKKGLTQKFTRITANSERFQTRIKEIQQKAEDYKTANNVELANYDSLLTAANTAGEESAAAIEAMSAVTPTVECASGTVASDVATFKAAAQDTRDKLKTYKTAVKAILTALHDAKAETTEATTEGAN